MGSLIHTGAGIHVTHSLRFTPGVALADLLAASMTAKPFHVFMIRHWWGSKLGSIMLPLTVWDQADTLLTESCWLGFWKLNSLMFTYILNTLTIWKNAQKNYYLLKHLSLAQYYFRYFFRYMCYIRVQTIKCHIVLKS